jgi:glycogen phosphorylase
MPLESHSQKIAYFSMEIGLESRMPTYSGGLGVLAGDTIRAAADLNVPMVAITLLHRKGYFHQNLDANGWQTEEPVEWIVKDFLSEVPQRATVTIEGRIVELRCWAYKVQGVAGHTVRVYFLDADLPQNSDYDRTLTHFLYGGDQYYRLCQEVILGIGGVRMLRALGYDALDRFHMNEGHAGLLVLELLDEAARKANRKAIADEDIESVRKQCVFTTHTPVPTGHDKFAMDLVVRVLGRREVYDRKDVFCCEGGLNMTYLALNLSHYVNGVAKKHGQISQAMFSRYVIDAITNGVHAATWVSNVFATLYDRYIADWKRDNSGLRYALSIPKEEIWQAHTEAKRSLISYANRETNSGFDDDVLTIGFARRATRYKRTDLLFTDIKRLRSIGKDVGPFQVIFAGKAHPQDREGKELIQRIFASRNALRKEIRIGYLARYDTDVARLVTAGSDVWLNTPEPPMEASGTSGMKAALNGVPSLSVLDGWWIEGHIEGVTGWSIGQAGSPTGRSFDRTNDATSLYDKLERVVIPTFYQERDRFLEIMRHCIALNGSFFNTHRMIQQYILKAYYS